MYSFSKLAKNEPLHRLIFYFHSLGLTKCGDNLHHKGDTPESIATKRTLCVLQMLINPNLTNETLDAA